MENASKKKIRDRAVQTVQIGEGQYKQREVNNRSNKKIIDILEGQNKQREVNNTSNRKFRGTPEGKNKGREVDNASKKKIRNNVQFDRDSAFEEVSGNSMVDPIILDTKVYKIIAYFLKVFSKLSCRWGLGVCQNVGGG